MYSDNTRKLMHWLFRCYANHCSGKEPEDKTTEYELAKAKNFLKKQYVKACGYKPDKKCLENFLKLMSDNTDTETFELLSKAFIKTLQDFAIQNDNFSVANALLNQKKANKLVNFLFDYLFDNDVPLRKEIIELLEKDEKDRVIFRMLLHKKCCVCGKPITGPHHIDRVGTQGYKHDTGLDKRLSPLCPYHHAEIETGNYTNEEFKEKYPSFDYMLCDEKQIEILKDVYPHHFQAFKEGKNGI